MNPFFDKNNWQVISINGYGLFVLQNYNRTRRNYSVSSKQFEQILHNSGINMSDPSQHYRFHQLVQATKITTLSDIQYQFEYLG